MARKDKRSPQGAAFPRLKWGKPLEQTVNLTGGSQEILAANINRIGAAIVNDGTQNVYLAVGHDAEVNKGIFLAAGGGSYEINTVNLTIQAVNGIAVADGGHVTKQEAE